MKKTILFSVTTFLLLLSGCNQQIITDQTEVDKEDVNQASATESTKKSEEWQLYRNGKLNYEVKVPKGVTINEHMDGDYVEIYRDEPSEKWSFGIIKNDEGLSIKEYVSKEHGEDCILSQENLKIASEDAVEILDKCVVGDPSYYDFLLIDGDIFVIEQIMGENKGRYDEILSSLRFDN